jgi:iron complex transport system ATP-binding protein
VTALALVHVGVELGRRPIVEDVSMTVGAGEWAALIGANGAGKTTTLRAIAGLVDHDGRVLIGGVDAHTLKRRERARRVAVVPQIPATPADMTVREYVLLGRTPHVAYFGTEGVADREAAHDALARLDLAAFADRRMGSLSGGERQRAVLARALAQQAGVVLLDEPTSALDLARQQQVLELVDELREQEGLAVVAAMHDLTAVASYADHVHLLSAGRVVASGEPREVLREDLLAAHFGASVRVIESDGELVVVAARARVAT